MTSSASGAVAVTRALDRLARDDRGWLLAALISRLGDFQLAEDALQDAMVSALSHWSRTGLPHSPKAWLLQVAWRKALDRIRRARTAKAAGADLSVLAVDEAFEPEQHEIPDERLRLIFTCCHPALEPKSQIALTLRTLGGLSTGEIARAFLDREPAMGQRLSRAKAKIAAAAIPFAVPDEAQWPPRLNAVLSVIYLIFNAGYSGGPEPGRDLAEEALYLAGLLDRLRPGDPEIEGCRALLVLTHARRAARIDACGATVAIGSQDRALWRAGEIELGLSMLDAALRRARPGPYQIKAAIAACHCQGQGSDWPQIALLYDALLHFEPSDVVRLNRAVALAETGRLDAALDELHRLEAGLGDYQPFHAARAELLSRKGCETAALEAYRQAIALAQNEADIRFLEGRMAGLSHRA